MGTDGKKNYNISIKLDKDLYEVIINYAASYNITKSEAIRKIILLKIYDDQKKEKEKIVTTLETFKKELIEYFQEQEQKNFAQSTRNLIYELTNHHLLKMILRDVVCSEMSADDQTETVRQYVSHAKGLAIKTHPIDSINSKENVTQNILQEHLN
ncbi:MAG: hypothetical protein WC667_04895 [Sulfurimonas sp.]|jgi:hypothetical protein